MTARDRITSSSNQRVRAAAALRDRAERDDRGLTLVDGVRELGRALDAGAQMVEVFACPPLFRTPEAAGLLDRLRVAGVGVVNVAEGPFGKIAFGERAEGVVGVVGVPSLSLERLRLPADPLVIVLEGVEKPGNLGAVLRSADGAGADALVAADPRTDLFNPSVIRASLGTIFAVPVAAAPTPDVRRWLADAEVRIVTARIDGERLYTEVDLTGGVALVLGSEAAGLSPVWSGPGVVPVHLPMLGVADSLNVSVAAAVLLYEARRQRGIPRGPA